MSGLVFAGIAPHGFSIIGEIAGSEFELFRCGFAELKIL